ncbi:MAG: anhydro-N-acetylmuramic acid kinase [Planctomycetota bacterium]
MATTAAPTPPRVRHVAGCMTGTSLDGLDAALSRITSTGLDMSAEHLSLVSVPLPDGLRDTLRSLAEGGAHPPRDILRAARHLGVVHAEAVAELLHQHPQITPDFVVAHGQTVCHAPDDALSWQLFDPWPIVRSLRLPVCYDLRQADLVAGGQGAPITPIADPILFGRAPSTTVVNLGGVCNLTHWGRSLAPLPPRVAWELEAYDLCPANLLLDGLARRLYGKPYDPEGVAAAAGRPRRALRRRIDAAVRRASGTRKTLGREQFGQAWVNAIVDPLPDAVPADWLASAVSWLTRTVAAEVGGRDPSRVVLAGGGVRHRGLRSRLERMLRPTAVSPSDDLGVPAEAREALAFTVLGALSQDRVPITLPAVTGAKGPGVAGAWAYPNGPG